MLLGGRSVVCVGPDSMHSRPLRSVRLLNLPHPAALAVERAAVIVASQKTLPAALALVGLVCTSGAILVLCTPPGCFTGYELAPIIRHHPRASYFDGPKLGWPCFVGRCVWATAAA
jgi:hypothetical protein